VGTVVAAGAGLVQLRAAGETPGDVLLGCCRAQSAGSAPSTLHSSRGEQRRGATRSLVLSGMLTDAFELMVTAGLPAYLINMLA
jgi:hypothetical protein